MGRKRRKRRNVLEYLVLERKEVVHHQVHHPRPHPLPLRHRHQIRQILKTKENTTERQESIEKQMKVMTLPHLVLNCPWQQQALKSKEMAVGMIVTMRGRVERSKK